MTTNEHILPITETVTPANEAEVVELLLAARHDRTVVYPIGGGTWLDYGAAATRPGVGPVAARARWFDRPCGRRHDHYRRGRYERGQAG